MYWLRKDTVKSSVAVSVSIRTRNYWRVSMSTICPLTHFNGIWIFVDMVRFRTPDLEWGLSEQWPGSAGSNTYVRPSPSPECCTGYTPSSSL
ncbi:hypothetical protein NSPZN2_10563 [Nitrospira defluvii]|uniref:Uncharacterized protein n=1 Tax=Nitrospira defluvii TaxID=330214 RepID=A0ABM8QI84_9BACT|nr:hypothetical protein NSPZN2_10563 [Nitrospira defluvii]